MKRRLTLGLCALSLIFGAGCSTAKRLASRLDPTKMITVQRTPAAEVNITRVKDRDLYDFYISFMEESGEPARTYIVKGFREQARAQFYRPLNSVFINDEGRALYALVIDKDIEYRFTPPAVDASPSPDLAH